MTRMQIKRNSAAGSIRKRLTLWSVFVLALVLVSMGIILRYTLQLHLMASIDRELEAERLATERRVLPWLWWPQRFPPPRQRSPRALQRPASGSLIRYRPRTFNLEGGPLLSYGIDVLWDRPSFALAARGTGSYITMQNNDDPIRLFSAPLRSRGKIVGVMQAAYSLTEMQHDLQGLSTTLVMLIPIALLIVGLGATFLMARLLRPVREVIQTASQISAMDLSQRLPVSGDDEFSRLATTFNAMLARLERSFDQQRRLTADASHELRTPLTAIKARTSLALSGQKSAADYRRALEIADRAATRMSRIVDDLLLLARSDIGELHLQIQSVPIQTILQAALETIQVQYHAPIELQQSDLSLTVWGDGSHLIRLFTNVLNNAAQHTPREGRITVFVEEDADVVRVMVTDTGGGIAPEHLSRLTERFYRADEARARTQGGTGLGLAISQSIVEAHHGTLTIESVFGEGTMVTVTLPRQNVEKSEE